MRLRPFVYISESLITKQNALNIVIQSCRDCGYDPDVGLLRELWKESTQSTRAQLHKYTILEKGYKQQALRSWYTEVLAQLWPAIHQPNSLEKPDSQLAQTIFRGLSDPRSYHIPDETTHFIADLDENDIQWGIIANENHLYPLVVKYLGLSPFKVISARSNMFKPLPTIFHNAWTKVPVACQHDVWFIGDSTLPYDNVQSKFMRTAVYTHGEICDLSSSQLRIAKFQDLYEELGLGEYPETDFDFDMGAHELQQFLDLPKNQLVEKGKRELGLVDVPKKSK